MSWTMEELYKKMATTMEVGMDNCGQFIVYTGWYIDNVSLTMLPPDEPFEIPDILKGIGNSQ